MALFTVTFQLKSYYSDDQFDKENVIKKEYDAEDIDSLFDILDDTDELDSIDDTIVINDASPEPPEEVNIEYVLIHDHEGKQVYKDDDYES